MSLTLEEAESLPAGYYFATDRTRSQRVVVKISRVTVSDREGEVTVNQLRSCEDAGCYDMIDATRRFSHFVRMYDPQPLRLQASDAVRLPDFAESPILARRTGVVIAVRFVADTDAVAYYRVRRDDERELDLSPDEVEAVQPQDPPPEPPLQLFRNFGRCKPGEVVYDIYDRGKGETIARLTHDGGGLRLSGHPESTSHV